MVRIRDSGRGRVRGRDCASHKIVWNIHMYNMFIKTFHIVSLNHHGP